MEIYRKICAGPGSGAGNYGSAYLCRSGRQDSYPGGIPERCDLWGAAESAGGYTVRGRGDVHPADYVPAELTWWRGSEAVRRKRIWLLPEICGERRKGPETAGGKAAEPGGGINRRNGGDAEWEAEFYPQLQRKRQRAV